jgi:hypothetical protein
MPNYFSRLTYRVTFFSGSYAPDQTNFYLQKTNLNIGIAISSLVSSQVGTISLSQPLNLTGGIFKTISIVGFDVTSILTNRCDFSIDTSIVNSTSIAINLLSSVVLPTFVQKVNFYSLVYNLNYFTRAQFANYFNGFVSFTTQNNQNSTFQQYTISDMYKNGTIVGIKSLTFKDILDF